MAKKIEISGKALLVTDTISGLVELSEPSARTWYKEADLKNGRISFYDLDSTEEVSGSFEPIALTDAVNSSLVAFTESTFRSFMLHALSNVNTTDYYLELSKNNIPNQSLVQKFGFNGSVGASYTPITSLGIYNTPQVGSATTLRIKAGGNANDTALGTGAREITIIGLDETGAEITETLATAGASASATTTATFIRLYRAYVSSSGTYATAVAGSQAATIIIENGTGGTDWGQIELNGFPLAQTRIGAYSVPLGKTAYIISSEINIESNKTVDIIFFQRQGILKTSAPYDAMRIVYQASGVTGATQKVIRSAFGPFPELTDIGFMAKVASGTAQVSLDFEIVLIDN